MAAKMPIPPEPIQPETTGTLFVRLLGHYLAFLALLLRVTEWFPYVPALYCILEKTIGRIRVAVTECFSIVQYRQ